jgi:deoxyribodipyrimidine photo-lyase
MHVVWFKRDLRIDDHQPLVEAIQQAGSAGVCCLYIYEPSLLAMPEWDRSHSIFIDQCLAELDQHLRKTGGHMTYRFGEVPVVLTALHQENRIDTLWSHEETGCGATYQRDLAVATWCKEHQVAWQEIPQHGVIRRLRSRDGWSRQ